MQCEEIASNYKCLQTKLNYFFLNRYIYNKQVQIHLRPLLLLQIFQRLKIAMIFFNFQSKINYKTKRI